MSGTRPGLLWLLGGAAVGVFLVLAFLGLSRLNGLAQRSTSEPVLTIIPIPTPTTVPSVEPTLAPPPSPTPSPKSDGAKQFATGELVQVAGTEGDGLRMRDGPTLVATILLLGLESEVFEVVDGPIEADGYTWWRLANPFDPSKQGWAVDQFLRSIGET